MTHPAPTPIRLLRLSEEFADEVTQRIGQVVPFDHKFMAVALGDNESGKVSVAVQDAEGLERPIVLTIDQRPKLSLLVKFHCCWDTTKDYLAVDLSMFHVRIMDASDEPLFRYEYVRQSGPQLPAAHVHVHAHRDEFLYLLTAGERGRPRDRARGDKVPRMSVFHFPLGGHRFRPCVEDILHVLITEFGVDTQPTWKRAIEEGRQSWRRTQLKAAVRDAPADAAAALETLGWILTPPQAAPDDKLDRLRAL